MCHSKRNRSPGKKEWLKPEYLTRMALTLCVHVERASLIPSAEKEKKKKEKWGIEQLIALVLLGVGEMEESSILQNCKKKPNR